MIYPKYATEFRCLGSSCEDTCCNGWNVVIDQGTYEKYQTLPASPLRTLIDGSIRRKPAKDGDSPSAFAFIQMEPPAGCPMQSAEGLCRVHTELGPNYLSDLCSSFPRATCTVDDIKIETLSLGCPEAVRLVLREPDLLTSKGLGTGYLTWDDKPAKPRDLRAYFWPIREFVVTLLQNRSYALWQRMFLLGTFCRRLEAVIRNEVEGGYAAMESGFSAAIASGGLRDHPSPQRTPTRYGAAFDQIACSQWDGVSTIFRVPEFIHEGHRRRQCHHVRRTSRCICSSVRAILRTFLSKASIHA